MLNRDQFLKAAVLKRKEITVPDLGTVIIREMTTAESVELARLAGKESDETLSYAIVRCVLDDKGKSLFQPDDADLIGDFPTAVVRTLNEEIGRLSGIGRQDDDEKEKSLSATAPADLNPASPSPWVSPTPTTWNTSYPSGSYGNGPNSTNWSRGG